MRESLTYETGLREECGVFGMFDLEGGDVARDMYYGLSALQHRGQEAAGIAVNKNGVIHCHKDTGLVSAVFNQEILDIKNQELSGSLTVYSRPSIAQCWLVPALGDFSRRYPAISLTVLTGNDNVNLQRAGIDLAIYFDDAPSSQLSHHFLMDEAIVPVCTPYYARQLQLTSNPASLRHCTLLHDRQAWSNDSGTDEWFSWAQQFGIELPQSSGIGFDRSDLAVIAAMNHVGVAMGRKRLVQKRLESGELIAPFGDMTLKCHQHYYVTTLPGRQWPKIDAFIEWLHSLT